MQRERANREAEAIAAEMAKRAYEANSGQVGNGGPCDEDLEEKAAKKAREEAAELARQDQSEQFDGSPSPEATKGSPSPGGGKGKGTLVRDDAHPYSQV